MPCLLAGLAYHWSASLLERRPKVRGMRSLSAKHCEMTWSPTVEIFLRLGLSSFLLGMLLLVRSFQVGGRGAWRWRGWWFVTCVCSTASSCCSRQLNDLTWRAAKLPSEVKRCIGNSCPVFLSLSDYLELVGFFLPWFSQPSWLSWTVSAPTGPQK